MATPGPTSFFEQQDLAKRNSRRLIWLFLLGVLAVIISLDLVVLFIYANGAADSGQQQFGGSGISSSEMPFDLIGVVSLTSLVTGSIIGLASLGKSASLSSGGSVIAEALGGRLLDPLDIRDPLEKRLLNVVEEMALASGLPVPPVYLMDQEEGINAFAAGFRPTDAVIGVTKGTLQSLNRDQLQGVIAHEFSHILNGDMRLNIRMIGLLYGLLFLGIMGRTILRVISDISYHSPRRSSSNKDEKGNPLAIIYLVAIALFVLGYVGYFFGRLIQAALSRQREFLADASAVQFTRNPDGIAGALKAIGGWANHSTIKSPESLETAHMFFGDAIKRLAVQSPFATHPPLDVRIKRLDPQWDGVYPNTEAILKNASNPEKNERKKPRNPLDIPGMPKIPGGSAIPPILAGFSESTVSPAPSLSQSVEKSLSAAGQPNDEQFGYAKLFLEMLPDEVHDLTYHPLEASCLILWLLKPNEEQIKSFPQPYRSEYTRVAKLIPEILRNYPVDLSKIVAPALRRLTSDQFSTLITLADQLIQADNRVNMSEWLVQRMLRNQLRRTQSPGRTSESSGQTMKTTSQAVSLIASALAWAGQTSDSDLSDSQKSEMANLAIQAGLSSLRNILPAIPDSLIPKSAIDSNRLDAALARISNESAQIRLAILKAAAAVIESDQTITKREFDLIRVLADTMGCPLPPIKKMF